MPSKFPHAFHRTANFPNGLALAHARHAFHRPADFPQNGLAVAPLEIPRLPSKFPRQHPRVDTRALFTGLHAALEPVLL